MKKSIAGLVLMGFLAYSNQVSALTDQQVSDLEAKLSANRQARKDGATAGYAQLIGFISDASVSGYILGVDNNLGSNINIAKLPLEKEIFSFEGADMLIRGGFNYASVDAKNILEGMSSDQILPESEAYSVLVGLLFNLPLSELWTLRPALDVGVGRIENRIIFEGADAGQVKDLVNSQLINWSTNTVLVNLGLGLDYKRMIDIHKLTAKSNYDHTIITSFNESGDFSGFTEQIDLLNFSFDLATPWGVDLFGYPLTGIVHESNTVFLGDNRNALGFNNLNALGYRVDTDLTKEGWKIESVSLGFNYLVGANVEGYEIVFNVDF